MVRVAVSRIFRGFLADSHKPNKALTRRYVSQTDGFLNRVPQVRILPRALTDTLAPFTFPPTDTGCRETSNHLCGSKPCLRCRSKAQTRLQVSVRAAAAMGVK